MNGMVDRTKIEILLDAPLARRAIDIVERAGVSGYTLFPASGGAGRSGRWSEDQITQADSKTLILTIAPHDKAQAIVAALEPLLQSHGIIVMTSLVQVIRPEKF